MKQKTIPKDDNCDFIQGSFYDIPVKENTTDVLISIRTLHHVQDINGFFKECRRVIKDGFILFEIPNKRNVLTIMRFLFKKISFNPFSEAQYYHSETFINYHPNYVKKHLHYNGFKIVKSVNTNFFRHPKIKSIVPNGLLIKMILCFNVCFHF